MKQLLTFFFVLLTSVAFSQAVTNTITLDGSLSSDSDGVVKTYLWSKASGPNGGDVMTGSGTVKPTVVFSIPGVYVYKLVVWDDKAMPSSNNPTVEITVIAANKPPHAVITVSNATIQLPAN